MASTSDVASISNVVTRISHTKKSYGFRALVAEAGEGCLATPCRGQRDTQGEEALVAVVVHVAHVDVLGQRVPDSIVAACLDSEAVGTIEQAHGEVSAEGIG